MIELVFGRQGSGKNVYAAYRNIIAKKAGWLTFSNCGIQGDYKIVDGTDLLKVYHLQQITGKPALVVIDEADIKINAEQLKDPLIKTNIKYARKRKMYVILIAQKWNATPPDIRAQTDSIIYCSNGLIKPPALTDVAGSWVFWLKVTFGKKHIYRRYSLYEVESKDGKFKKCQEMDKIKVKRGDWCNIFNTNYEVEISEKDKQRLDQYIKNISYERYPIVSTFGKENEQLYQQLLGVEG